MKEDQNNKIKQIPNPEYLLQRQIHQVDSLSSEFVIRTYPLLQLSQVKLQPVHDKSRDKGSAQNQKQKLRTKSYTNALQNENISLKDQNKRLKRYVQFLQDYNLKLKKQILATMTRKRQYDSIQTNYQISNSQTNDFISHRITSSFENIKTQLDLNPHMIEYKSHRNEKKEETSCQDTKANTSKQNNFIQFNQRVLPDDNHYHDGNDYRDAKIYADQKQKIDKLHASSKQQPIKTPLHRPYYLPDRKDKINQKKHYANSLQVSFATAANRNLQSQNHIRVLKPNYENNKIDISMLAIETHKMNQKPQYFNIHDKNIPDLTDLHFSCQKCHQAFHSLRLNEPSIQNLNKKVIERKLVKKKKQQVSSTFKDQHSKSNKRDKKITDRSIPTRDQTSIGHSKSYGKNLTKSLNRCTKSKLKKGTNRKDLKISQFCI